MEQDDIFNFFKRLHDLCIGIPDTFRFISKVHSGKTTFFIVVLNDMTCVKIAYETESTTVPFFAISVGDAEIKENEVVYDFLGATTERSPIAALCLFFSTIEAVLDKNELLTKLERHGIL